MDEKLLQELVQKLPEEDRPKVSEPAKKRQFAGFKMTISINADGFVAKIPVRYAKLESTVIKEKLRIVHRAADGREVHSRKICKNCGKAQGEAWAYVDDQGNVHPDDQVHHFQILDDGSEIEVAPLERTTELEVVKTPPSIILDDLLIESEYEVWSEDPAALWALAEWLHKNDRVAVGKHTFGRTFYENYAILYPIIRDGQFVMVMALAKMRKEFKHWMPVGGRRAESKPKAKPVSVLPELF